jgi:hypothetical protein
MFLSKTATTGGEKRGERERRKKEKEKKEGKDKNKRKKVEFNRKGYKSRKKLR